MIKKELLRCEPNSSFSLLPKKHCTSVTVIISSNYLPINSSMYYLKKCNN